MQAVYNEYGSSDIQLARQDMRQFSTFSIAGELYGIDVTLVQEVVRPMPATGVPLAPDYVVGLINLRGQIATAIGMRELFAIPKVQDASLMNVVCRIDGSLISLQVDEIGDVIEVQGKHFEPTPQTVPERIRRFMSGIYKTQSSLLSIIDIELIRKFLTKKN